MSDSIQHEDFGEKIGGARKDLWMQRGLYADDLSEMNSGEIEKYVKKDNIWKKPDYPAMLDAGASVDLTYFLKVVRDSLNASPRYYRTDDTPEKRLARQKQYIDTVREIQTAMEQVQTVEDALSVFDTCLIGGGYYERAKDSGIMGGYYAVTTAKGRENPVISDKLCSAIFFRSQRDFERNIVQEAMKQQFGIPKEQKVPQGFEIHFNDGKNTYSKEDNWRTNTYYVVKGHRILKTNFETREDALKWAQEFAKQRPANGKKRFMPEQLAEVKRDGPDYRAGRDIVGQDYLDTFQFRGGEFGNWMNQNDRRASLNMGFDALKDLASALQISETDISYGGVLAIAFGARGGGKAVAHYEPERKVINLTKMRGAGSLAHEWWHGLDDFLGEKMGVKGYLSENVRSYPLMKKLVDTMKYKPETLEQASKRAAQDTLRSQKNAEVRLDAAVLSSLRRTENDTALNEYAALKNRFLAGETGMVDKISDLKKSVTGRVIPKEERKILYSYETFLHSLSERTGPAIGRTETDYYRNSKKMGRECQKDGGYWESEVEMTARAFACYVKDKLPYRSDYLNGHAECAVTLVPSPDGNMDILKAYPQGEERKAINAVLDEIILDLKREQILTHVDRPQPLQEAPATLEQLVNSRLQSEDTPTRAKSHKSHGPER